MRNLRSLTLAIGVGSMVLMAEGCSSSGPAGFENSPSLSAAESRIKVRSASNGNSEIKLQVKHMTPPDKVKSGTSTYVVWAQPTDTTDAPMMNLGQMTPDKDLKAEFQSVTPYRKFKILLTPESDRSARAPTADPVLWTKEIKGSG